MPLSRDDYKTVLRSVVDTGIAMKNLTEKVRWSRATLEESRALTVLAKVVSVGLDAEDALELMLENDR